MKIEQSVGNGHCLVISICKSLASQKNVIISSDELFKMCEIELEDNLKFYTTFYTGEDIFREFEDHMNNKSYDLQIVDIMLQVLANALNTALIVADVRAENIIETTFPPRASGTKSADNSLLVIRKGEHFDALLKEVEKEVVNDDWPWGDGEPGLVDCIGNFPYVARFEVSLNNISFIKS